MPRANDPAILGAAAGGGGRKPSARAADLQAAVDIHQEQARADLAGGVLAIHEQLAQQEAARDATFQGTVLAKVQAADKANVRIRKVAAAASNTLNDKVQDHINSARKELRSVGSELPALPEDWYIYNHLGEHDRLALQDIILPALKQREAEMQAPTEEGEQSLPPPQKADGIGLPVGYKGPVVMCDGVQAHPTLPPGYSFVDCDGLPWRGQEEGGGGVNVCVDGQPVPAFPARDDCTSPPTSPPPPPDEPPASPPPPAACKPTVCPTPQLVIRMDGCPDIVVGGGVSVSPPMAPPTSPPPHPDDPIPLTPAPPPPPGRSPPPPPSIEFGGPTPMGVHDGPVLCTTLQVSVDVANLGKYSKTGPQIRNSVDVLISQVELWPLVGGVASGVLKIGFGMVAALQEWGRTIGYQLGVPNPVVASESILAGSLAGFAEKWLGTPLAYWMQPVEQAARYANPLNLLSQGGIDSAHLTGGLTLEQWTCLTKANGNMPWQHYQVVYGSRSRANADQVIALWRRDIISEALMRQYMRNLGFLDQAEVDQMLRLSEYVPSTQELFTWIKKDVHDEAFAALAGLDEDFPDPLPPAFQRWFAANGTTAQQIKYDYRSQWNLPSTTMLAEMQARLRPGRVPTEIVTPPSMVDELLKLDEWPKGLRPRIEYILTQTVNRTDIGAAYIAGTMDEREVYERLLDLKYTPTDAAALRDLLVVKGEQQQQQSIGAWTRRTIIKKYIGGALDRDKAGKLLSRTIKNRQRMLDALADADLVREAQKREACIAGLKKRYMLGEWTTPQVRNLLIGQGMDMEQADGISEAWYCSRASRIKEPTVKMLMDWIEWGLIDWGQMDQRLRNLGYSPDDAERIRQSTDAALRKKAAKEAQAAQDRAEAKARQRKKDQQDAAKNGSKKG